MVMGRNYWNKIIMWRIYNIYTWFFRDLFTFVCFHKIIYISIRKLQQ